MAGVCGKDCGSCGFRAEHGCRGCLETEGRPVWGTCRIVSCCHGRGLQNCGQCPSSATCGAIGEMEGQRERWPQEEALRQAAAAERLAVRRQELAWRAPVLAKWLLVLFWLSIVSGAMELLDKLELGYGAAVALNLAGSAMGFAVLFIYWKLSKLSHRFRVVWWLEVAIQAVALVVLALVICNGEYQWILAGGSLDLGGWMVAAVGLSLAVMALGIAALYQFCEAMAEQAESADLAEEGPARLGTVSVWDSRGQGGELAKKWRLLRKWLLGSIAAIAGGFVLAMVLGILGALVMLAAMLALIGCMIAELVLLWQSAGFFRQAEERVPLPL